MRRTYLHGNLPLYPDGSRATRGDYRSVTLQHGPVLVGALGAHLPSFATATVHLRVGPCPNSTQYTFQSEITSHVTRAIQEAAIVALLLLRTFDHNMASHSRYTHFPRMDAINSDTIFTSLTDVGSPITQLLRLTSLLLEYLQETLTILNNFCMDLASSEMSRILGRDIVSGIPLPSSAPALPPPAIPRCSSWKIVRNSFPSPPATQSPYAPTHHSAAPLVVWSDFSIAL
jgi:hypothetical protein